RHLEPRRVRERLDRERLGAESLAQQRVGVAGAHGQRPHGGEHVAGVGAHARTGAQQPERAARGGAVEGPRPPAHGSAAAARPAPPVLTPPPPPAASPPTAPAEHAAINRLRFTNAPLPKGPPAPTSLSTAPASTIRAASRAGSPESRS